MSAPKIAACLIVKNSEQTLQACLEPLRPHVDEINLYDTGSTDGTLALVERLNEQTDLTVDVDGEPQTFPLAPIRIEQGEWRDDFAWAREQSFQMASPDCDWLLWLDDDDEIVGARELRRLTAQAPPDCMGFVMFYDYARDESGNCVCQLWRERLIRRSAGLRWVNAVHEVLVPPEGVPPAFAHVDADVVKYVHHRPADRYAPDRNLLILLAEKERAEAETGNVPPRILAYLGTEYASKSQWGEAAQHLIAYVEHPEALWPDERAQVHHKLATCLRMLGRPLAAVEAEMRAIQERDDWAENLVGLAAAFAALGRWDRAERWARGALALGMPQSPLILNPLEHHLLPLILIADACVHQGKFDEAQEAIRAAAARFPGQLVEDKRREVEAAANEADLVGAVLLLREVLVRHDENLKAHQLLQCVPYVVAEHQAITQAKAEQAEMVAHALRPDEYRRWYSDEPKESTVPDDLVETIDEYIERAAFLLEGLRDQEEALGRKPRVLDLGCNDFWLAAFLWRKAGIPCDGVELNRASVEKGLARKECFGAPGEIIQCDLRDASAHFGSGMYDAVVLFEVLEHVPDVAETLDALEELLTDDGRVYLTTPNGAFDRGADREWARVARKNHLRALTANDLAELLTARGDLADFRVHADGRLSFAAYTPASRKGSVVFYAGGSWEEWSPRSVKQGGLGGSETALVQVAVRMAEEGYYVRVYSGATPGIYGKVSWRPFTAWDPTDPVDLLVASRLPGAFDLPVYAKRTALWCHDHSYPGSLTPERAARIDSVIVLSEWQRERFARLYPFAAEKLVVVRNGISYREMFTGAPRYTSALRPFAERKPRVVYSSSADRGLDVLLELWPRIRERAPEAELHVFYGWHVFDRVAMASPDLIAFKTRVFELVHEAGGEAGGVFMRGRVGQVELAEEFQQARVLAYPTAFLETSCITAMEARAAGLPIVASDLGALRETVGEHGILVEWGPLEDDQHNRSPEYQAAFVECVSHLLTNERYWQRWHLNALRDAETLDWSERLPGWEALLAGEREAVAA